MKEESKDGGRKEGRKERMLEESGRKEVTKKGGRKE